MKHETLYLLPPLITLVSSSVHAQQTPEDTKKQPNVIIILADDLGYGDLECYGASRVQTPNVNRLAAEGIRFTNVHATASTSTPSRYALLTGEYAWRKKGTGVAEGNAGMIIRPEQYTLADMFKSAGYATGAIGKWHLGLGDKTASQNWNGIISPALEELGFDYSYIMAATADRVPCVYIENGKVANYDPQHPIYVDYHEPFEGEPLGSTHTELLYNLHPSHGHDMAIVNGISRIGYMKGGGKALWKDENIADTITNRAIQFIEKNKEHPFFLYFATNDVHVPRFPHERFRGKNAMGLRGDAIVQFDWSVGEIMKVLDRLKLTENTLIILSSDNGPVLDDGYKDRAAELAGTHKPGGPFRGGKYGAFEAGTCVPAIVRYPAQVKKNRVLNTLLSQVDWFRSLASLINVSVPEGMAQDSWNYMNSWLGKSKKDRHWVIEESNILALSVRKGKWKYIEPSNGSPVITWGPAIETGYAPYDQLFNMGKSDFEDNNVAKQYPVIVREMKEILNKERKGASSSDKY